MRTYWCAPNSQTYVVFKTTMIIATTILGQEAIEDVLASALQALDGLIQNQGDGVIANGVYLVRGERNTAIGVRNANNHQLTYGVARAAIAALENWMSLEFNHGFMQFEIWDGDNQVGIGKVGPTRRAGRRGEG